MSGRLFFAFFGLTKVQWPGAALIRCRRYPGCGVSVLMNWISMIVRRQATKTTLTGTDSKTAFERDGLLDELKKALPERALNAEMDHHLDVGESDGNREKIGSMYARGMGIREIQWRLRELYTNVTDTVLEKALKWQKRFMRRSTRLSSLMRSASKCSDWGTVRKKAIYVTLGVRWAGRRAASSMMAVDRSLHAKRTPPRFLQSTLVY